MRRSSSAPSVALLKAGWRAVYTATSRGHGPETSIGSNDRDALQSRKRNASPATLKRILLFNIQKLRNHEDNLREQERGLQLVVRRKTAAQQACQRLLQWKEKKLPQMSAYRCQNEKEEEELARERLQLEAEAEADAQDDHKAGSFKYQHQQEHMPTSSVEVSGSNQSNMQIQASMKTSPPLISNVHTSNIRHPKPFQRSSISAVFPQRIRPNPRSYLSVALKRSEEHLLLQLKAGAEGRSPDDRKAGSFKYQRHQKHMPTSSVEVSNSNQSNMQTQPSMKASSSLISNVHTFGTRKSKPFQRSSISAVLPQRIRCSYAHAERLTAIQELVKTMIDLMKRMADATKNEHTSTFDSTQETHELVDVIDKQNPKSAVIATADELDNVGVHKRRIRHKVLLRMSYQQSMKRNRQQNAL